MFNLFIRRPWGLPALIAAGLLLQTAACLADEPLAIQNPGFEDGMTGWHAAPSDTDGKLSTVSADAAHSGTNGLHVKQDATGPGSWIQSSKITIEPGKSYKLHFWARCHQVSGVGIFFQFFDANGTNIPSKLAFQVPQEVKEWTQYDVDVAAPANAATVSFAVHCYSKHDCDADFDDFSLTP